MAVIGRRYFILVLAFATTIANPTFADTPNTTAKIIAINAKGLGVLAPSTSASWQVENKIAGARNNIFLAVLPNTKKLEMAAPSIRVVYWFSNDPQPKGSGELFASMLSDYKHVSSDMQLTALKPCGDYDLVRISSEATHYYRVLASPHQLTALKPLRDWVTPLSVIFQGTARNVKELDRTEAALRAILSSLTTAPVPKETPKDWYSYPVINPCINLKGIQQVQKLVDAGDSGAMVELGLCSLQKNDTKSSAKWLRAAADKGDVHAEFNLGELIWKFGGGVAEGLSVD